jgi:membrane fusion protein (multidrug efflux system)
MEAARAATAAAQAQLGAAETRLAKAVIRSPMDGTVAFRGVNVGDRVENMGGDFPMFRIVDNRLLELTVSVPSTRLSVLRVGQPLEFTTDAAPGRAFTGTVMFINPAVDSLTRSAKVIADVPNENEELRGGLFVKSRILIGARTGVLQIPRAALISWDVERASGEVFVINGGVAERRQVQTGAAAGEAIEVVQGLAAGEQVVTRGGFNLRPGDGVAVASPQGA